MSSTRTIAFALICAALPAAAQELELTVESDRPAAAASQLTLGQSELALQPISSPEDVLRFVPGLVLAQHQGGGKADQLFLRGFDADHGTDVAVSLDGVPVNQVSHAHGQGYADLHFLIPEVLERVDVSKGPYFAELGDFDTAGAVDLRTRRSFESSFVVARTGAFPTLTGDRDDGTPRAFAGYRVAGVASTDGPAWLAAEVAGTGGPFLFSERLQRLNLMGRALLGPVTLLATAYGSGWHGSGQIPERLVDAGRLDRFGSLDPSEGGIARRLQLIATWSAKPDRLSTVSATASATRSTLTLFNDFTFQARDPVHGDEIEQDDRRTTLYGALRYERRLPLAVASAGAQGRFDHIDASLWHAEQRARLDDCGALPAPCVDTVTRELDTALWGQLELRPAASVRLITGLRGDLFQFYARSRKASGGLDPQHDVPLPSVTHRSIASPKLSAIWSPAEALELFADFGSGFHSNDARSAVETSGAGALPRALGCEAGARGRLLDGALTLTATAWRLDLESELVWSGDAGGTEPSGATRRYGLELEGRWLPVAWLSADLDFSLSRARYKVDPGNGGAIALAPSVIVTGGVAAHHPDGLTGSLRLRHIGDRSACDPSAAPGCTLTARGYVVLDASAGYETRLWSLLLLAENLTNADYREAQFGNASRVLPEPAPVDDVHLTPGNPLTLSLSGTLRFR